ncbi:hypothetical protein CC80DRAFT_487364 [Byssothecium circinans]|uniref:Uncharacterized protein n=1 Tax=Byssothecium circinans TaxID=147558 RepID=A0A6A5UG54_9PLEO|nr:hypothetical protein CC80DRAFT_487364 [Byssothecium circinans]
MVEGVGNPLKFDSKTLNALVLIASITSVLLPVVWTIYRIIKDFHIEWVARRTKARSPGVSDVESQIKTELEIDGTEANGGLCELEDPGLPELSGVSVLEMWDQWCAGEVCGRGLVAEMDAPVVDEVLNAKEEVVSEEVVNTGEDTVQKIGDDQVKE